MSLIDIAGVTENVTKKTEFNIEKAKSVLCNETIAIIGYGVQGPAQALNLRDNGFRVIIGQRSGTESYDKAQKDGWTAGETLFSIDQACERATVIVNLLSDAGQIHTWPEILHRLTEKKLLIFSHGFAINFSDKTGIKPPKNIDVTLVAPKGSGKSVRELFKQGKGINASYAIHQDYTGSAKDKTLAYGIAIGSGYLFSTSFKKEVVSDLVGERGVLMGALAGIIEAQYDVLRSHGHSPSEAFNETVEELTQSLVPLVGEHGMDWMYSNCSTTAQRGALDWLPRFKQVTKPIFEELYEKVESGVEAGIVIDSNSQPDYKKLLNAELKEMADREIWQAGKEVRQLRPENAKTK